MSKDEFNNLYKIIVSLVDGDAYCQEVDAKVIDKSTGQVVFKKIGLPEVVMREIKFQFNVVQYVELNKN